MHPISQERPLPRWLRANGLELAYLGQGQGPLVLLLHGFPDTAWSFLPVMRLLAEAGFHAVAPFMRGYAPTSLAPDGNYRVTALAADAAALVQALGAQRAWLVGHDWGAAAAYAAATLYPQRFFGVATAAVPHTRHFLLRPALRQLYRSRYMAFFQLRGLAERRIVAQDFAALRALIQRWSPGWKFTADDLEPLRASFSLPERLRAALAYYRALPPTLADRAVLRQLLQPVPLPALVIRGSDDGCIGAEMFEGQEDCFGDSYRLETLQGAGHFMHCEQPHAFARLLLAFFRTPRSR